MNIIMAGHNHLTVISVAEMPRVPSNGHSGLQSVSQSVLEECFILE